VGETLWRRWPSKVFCLQRGFYQLSRIDVQELSLLARERLRLLRVWETLRGKGDGFF